MCSGQDCNDQGKCTGTSTCLNDGTDRVAGMSFKKAPQAMSLSQVEEGRSLQALAPGTVARSPVSLSSSLPFTPINLIFRASCHHTTQIIPFRLSPVWLHTPSFCWHM